MAQELYLLSPEKALLSLPLASLGSRIAAQLIDAVIIYAILTALIMLAAFTNTIVPLMPVLVAFPFLYFILLEWLWNGKTIGKLALRIRTRMADGTPLTGGAAVGRNLMRMADFLPGFYAAGYVTTFLNPRCQRLGDIIAGTVVVSVRQPSNIMAVAPHQAGIHAMEDQVGELRGMTNDEYVALKQLADRFYELPAAVQQKMINEVYLPIARKRGVPQPAGIHPIFMLEATVMKYGRIHGLL
ncbi:MAG: RDD family protein [Armatimonadetes bacterium]|nr:RDD family protein [Armatimonadota bacterium]